VALICRRYASMSKFVAVIGMMNLFYYLEGTGGTLASCLA
jgi:hypothetical protein